MAQKKPVLKPTGTAPKPGSLAAFVAMSKKAGKGKRIKKK